MGLTIIQAVIWRDFPPDQDKMPVHAPKEVPERQWHALREHAVFGRTFREIGEEAGVTSERARQLATRGLEKFYYLTNNHRPINPPSLKDKQPWWHNPRS